MSRKRKFWRTFFWVLAWIMWVIGVVSGVSALYLASTLHQILFLGLIYLCLLDIGIGGAFAVIAAKFDNTKSTKQEPANQQ